MLKTLISHKNISRIRNTFKTLFNDDNSIKRETRMPLDQLKLFISKAAESGREVILQLDWGENRVEEVSGTISLPHSRTDAIILKRRGDHALGYPVRINQINYLALKDQSLHVNHYPSVSQII